MELKQLIPLSILLFGCQPEQWNDCMTSTGSMSTQERIVGDFNTIDVGDRVDLVLEERSSGSVSVEAGANLLGQITTEVSDGTLKVRNEMRCNWVRSFKPRIVVHVPVDQVAKLVLRGTGNVSCTDSLIRDRFELEQWGAQGSASLLLASPPVPSHCIPEQAMSCCVDVATPPPISSAGSKGPLMPAA
ncbi:MAG: DUF2807 domain-containing protein [Flavobacteriales bacterium]|nr:DUF2807 domain-containing protein [Flavobacteriales bacterium]